MNYLYKIYIIGQKGVAVMDKLKKDVGKRLAEIRKTKKMKQEDLMELIEAPTVQMISGWENGHSLPSATYLIKIAKKLDISLDYLLLGEGGLTNEKEIRTYKDAAKCMIKLSESGLFKFEGIYAEIGDNKIVELSSTNKTLCDFRRELDNLLVASKTLRHELYMQAVEELLDKYDIPIENYKQ